MQCRCSSACATSTMTPASNASASTVTNSSISNGTMTNSNSFVHLLGMWCSANNVRRGGGPYSKTRRRSWDLGEQRSPMVAHRRRVCLALALAAGAAFVFGVLVGFTMHLYVPSTSGPSVNGPSRVLRTRSVIVDDFGVSSPNINRKSNDPNFLEQSAAAESSNHLVHSVDNDHQVVPMEAVTSATPSPPALRTVIQPPLPPLQQLSGLSVTNVSHLVHGIYWAERLETLLPAGYGDSELDAWRTFSRKAPVVRLADGCGRMQNRMLVFENGTRACGRYRQNGDQIQGEVFSALLARLLGIKNLPPASMALPGGRPNSGNNVANEQWRRVHGQLALAQWREDRPLVLTQFIDGLEPAYIPHQLRGSDRRLHPVSQDLIDISEAKAIELAQWSDLIVFDYLTANLDRVVNNLYNKQWNPDMMAAPAHNLARRPDSGLLLFLDNESGLLHGYRLLDKYEPYHRALLDALCVFRQPTVATLRRLQSQRNIGEKLKRELAKAEPEMTEWLQPLPDRNVKILMERINHVLERVQKCQELYGPS